MSENATAETKSIIDLKNKANSIINSKTMYAAGAGLIPFPVVDIAVLLGVQLSMIKSIAELFDQKFEEKWARHLVTTLVGGLGTAGVVSGVKAIPIVGSVVGMFTAPVTGAAATYALGKVFTHHFSHGGTLLSFDPVKSRKHFQQAYEEGTLKVEDLSSEENKKGFFDKLGYKDDLDDLKAQNKKTLDQMAELNAKLEKLLNGSK